MDQAIMVDLDTLLDTRIATLSKINEQAAVRAVSSKDYYSRSLNDFTKFGGISLKQFEEEFAKRNVETLKASLPTAAIFALRVMINDLAKQHQDTPFADDVKLIINFYPYTLQPLEIDSMQDIMGLYSGLGKERVVFEYLPWDALSPSYIKSRFTGLMMYNYREWMERQQDNFLRVRIPEIVILAPALYKEREPVGDEAKLKGGEQFTPFDITERMLVGCYDLHFLDVSYFSLIPPQAFTAPISSKSNATPV